jgi:hypothetical protein
MPAHPAFLITVDTEGDNLWSRPRAVTTRNAQYLPRFQALCEQYRLKPTYLTNWEMGKSSAFQEFGRDVLSRGMGEIGMHLHAWDSPPLVPLTDDDQRYHPYLIEYPEDQMREKVHVMTAALEDTFGTKMVSHRAGRWGFDERYARILVEHGYHIDCSITPYRSWRSSRGDPAGSGGPDYSRFPDASYFLDLSNIRRPGESDLLEVPVTVILHRYPRIVDGVRGVLGTSRFGERVANRLFPSFTWFYPGIRSQKALLKVLPSAWHEGRPYVEITLHSSELMPGGSPTFPSAASIESLYHRLEMLFVAAQDRFEGRTLGEYYDSLPKNRRPVAGTASAQGE